VQELKEQHEEKLAQLKRAHSAEIATWTQQLNQVGTTERQLRDDMQEELLEVRSELQQTRAAHEDMYNNKLKPAQVRSWLPPLSAALLSILGH
jgi:gas vesicle protein